MLRCAECGAPSDELAIGWRGYLAGAIETDPVEEQPMEVLLFCPACAAREFGPLPRRGGRA